MTSTLFRLAGGTVLTFDDRMAVHDGGEVWFRDGRIVAAGMPGVWRPAAGEPVETVDASGRIVVPGFVNAHSHSYTAILKGTVEKDPLDIYMLHVIAAGAAMTPREIYVSAQLDALSMLRFGITSVIDHHSERPALTAAGLDAVCRAFDDIGIRATVAPMFSDKPYIDTIPLDPDALPAEIREWYAAAPVPDPAAYFAIVADALAASGRVRVVLGVDGPQRCSGQLMRMTAEFQRRHGAALHTHMLETKTQAAMRRGEGFVRRMVDSGILNERSSLVHFIWSRDDDIAAAREAGVTVVHCPQSNLMLGAGICPVLRLREAGIQVAFGTDGSNCGPANYLENLRLATGLMRLTEPDFEKWPDSDMVLKEAYAAGARAAGWPGETGEIAPGARADLVVFRPLAHLHRPMEDPYRHLLHYENGSSVESVWVDGRMVVEDGRVVTVDEDALIAEAEEISARRRASLPPEAAARIEAQHSAFRSMILEQLAADAGMERRVSLR